jgi:hypothetical protein
MTLYMVEMDMPHRDRLAEWHDWYKHHLERLIAIPGFLTAQRFGADGSTASPYLAVYTVANADVLTSAAYRAKAGPTSTGHWQSLMTNWHRNVVEGLDQLPEIPHDSWLALMDRKTQAAPPIPNEFAVLRPVALDRSFIERGLLVGGAGTKPPSMQENADWSLRTFRPLSTQLMGKPEDPGPATTPA